MSIFSKLFGKPEAGVNQEKAEGNPQQIVDVAKLAAFMTKAAETNLNKLAAEKDARPAVTEKELFQCFAEYFAPNRDFYSEPGSEKYNAYFGAINEAEREMLNNPKIFERATKWDISQLIEMLKNPNPGITSMLVCGLIFRVGDYCVLKSSLYCVDFCEKIPYCIAVYLFLTAHKLPKEQRKQLIDSGDGSDSTSFKAAMKSLQILDPDWSFTIV